MSQLHNNSLLAKKYTYLSLFSGCGGFDIGFEQNGFESKGAFDIDPSVVNVYKNNLSGPIYKQDLTESILPIDYKVGEIDVIISGSPCQGFSTAGLRKIDDPRNKLLLTGGLITEKLLPKFFIGENVMGSISGEHKAYWDKLHQILIRNNYNIKFIKCDGVSMGLAQLRKRVFIVAWRGNYDLAVEFDKSDKITLKDVLSNVNGLPNQDCILPVKKEETKKLLTYIKPGQKLCNVRGGINSVHTWHIPSIFGKVTDKEEEILQAIRDVRRKIRIRKNGDADPVKIDDLINVVSFKITTELDSLIDKNYIKKIGENTYELKNTFNGLYKRLKWDQPSMTVDTRFGNARYFLHPEEMRGFSVREAARIQGFADDFIFSGTINHQFKMIGNAVPPPMANGIARIIKKNLIENE